MRATQTLRTTLASAFAVVLVLALVFVPTSEHALVRIFPQYRLLLEHLPGRSVDPGDPVYEHFGEAIPRRLDNHALRRAAALVPDDASYAIAAPRGPMAGDVENGAQLFFAPALRRTDIARADWVLLYKAGVPSGLRVARRFAIGGGFSLIRVAR